MAIDETLQGKTLKELQALAKSRGLKRYSKLTKPQIIALLAQAATKPASTKQIRTKKERAQESTKKVTAPLPPASAVVSKPPSAVTETPAVEATTATTATESRGVAEQNGTEQWVEQAKYSLRPNGRAPAESFTDLGEDIDRLPSLTEPVVCLMSQKPGVLHAYWVLPSGDAGQRNDYKLRLCRADASGVNVLQEVTVQTSVGNWYFHVDAASHVNVQLGYYENGRFVTARGRSVAALPSLYASTRTDDRWWISDSDFRQMYLRAGGYAAAGRFAWNASIGSPGGAPAPGKQLAWPGGVSSSRG